MYFTTFEPIFLNGWELLVNGCSPGFPNAFLLYAKIKGFLKLDDVQRLTEGKFTLDVPSNLLCRASSDPFARHVFSCFDNVDLLT